MNCCGNKRTEWARQQQNEPAQYTETQPEISVLKGKSAPGSLNIPADLRCDWKACIRGKAIIFGFPATGWRWIIMIRLLLWRKGS